MFEKTLTSEHIYKGKVIDVYRDEVEISTGAKSLREVVKHSGGVVILAIKNNYPPLERGSESAGCVDPLNASNQERILGWGQTILMVKQYRYPIKQTALELPAGKLEPGEDPFDCAKRELEEETGYVAKNWESLGYIYTSAGFCDEKLYLYKATDLEYKKFNPEDGEIIECLEYNLDEVIRLIKTGEINDAKTICAIMRACCE